MEILFLDLSTAGFSNKMFVIKNQGYWHLVQLINSNHVSFPQHPLTIKEPDQYIRTLKITTLYIATDYNICLLELLKIDYKIF